MYLGGRTQTTARRAGFGRPATLDSRRVAAGPTDDLCVISVTEITEPAMKRFHNFSRQETLDHGRPFPSNSNCASCFCTMS